MSSMAKVFEFDRRALNVPRAVAVVLVLVAMVIVLEVLDLSHYVVTVVPGLNRSSQQLVLAVNVSTAGDDWLVRAAKRA